MPLTLLEVSPSHMYVVLEIGTNAPGEIAALGEVCRPDIAVITSIGLEHLEKLGDLEGVAREEASIAKYVQEDGTLILPAGAEELLKALKRSKAQRILVGGLGEGGDLVLTNVDEGMTGTTFSINERGAFGIPLLGGHNAANALMAIAVARRMGVSDAQIAAGLAKVKGAEGRFEPMEVGGLRIIHDAYNANPSSMDVSLRTFARLKPENRGAKKSRKVVVLADMLELGVSGDDMHRNVGALVASLGFDLFIAIGKQMGYAANVAEAAAGKRGSLKVVRFANTAEAHKEVAELLKPADNMLFKGSHGMALETLIEALRAPPPIKVIVKKPTRARRGVRAL